MVARGPVTVLDPKGITAEDDRNTMARITMPRRSLAGCEKHPPNECCAASVEYFFGHDLYSSRSVI
jgi:hypothetical protein